MMLRIEAQGLRSKAVALIKAQRALIEALVLQIALASSDHKLRSPGGLQLNQFLSASTPSRLLHVSSHIHQTLTSAPSRNPTTLSSFPRLAASPLFHYPTMVSSVFPSAVSLVQVRGVSSRDRRSKRTLMTPVVSKVKKTKTKFYSHVVRSEGLVNVGRGIEEEATGSEGGEELVRLKPFQGAKLMIKACWCNCQHKGFD
ncbi:hypothetical protein CRG98_005716 [Punica granatum]|uniref:Uncharacterized protein n=1 Tax=Punica granatum TaxID=22663 RepID=A0A2I0L152_PUNGR|nr:hypothetical protein CRG98_005716 [Punica granatum]